MSDVLSFSHIGINVRDLHRSTEFYQRLGFQTVLESELSDPNMALLFALPYFKSARFAMLALPGHTPTRFEYRDPKYIGEVPKAANALGTVRLCLRVRDIRKLYGELKAEGVEFLNEPAGPGFLLTVALDPDGNFIEFFDENMIPEYVA